MSWEAVDALMTQRDAVLFGTWTNTLPVNADEACLIRRVEYKHPQAKRPLATRVIGIRPVALVYLRRAIEAFGNRRDAHLPWVWNDRHCRTKEQVLWVLDEAIRLAKEDATEESASVLHKS